MNGRAADPFRSTALRARIAEPQRTEKQEVSSFGRIRQNLHSPLPWKSASAPISSRTYGTPDGFPPPAKRLRRTRRPPENARSPIPRGRRFHPYRSPDGGDRRFAVHPFSPRFRRKAPRGIRRIRRRGAPDRTERQPTIRQNDSARPDGRVVNGPTEHPRPPEPLSENRRAPPPVGVEIRRTVSGLRRRPTARFRTLPAALSAALQSRFRKDGKRAASSQEAAPVHHDPTGSAQRVFRQAPDVRLTAVRPVFRRGNFCLRRGFRFVRGRIAVGFPAKNLQKTPRTAFFRSFSRPMSVFINRPKSVIRNSRVRSRFFRRKSRKTPVRRPPKRRFRRSCRRSGQAVPAPNDSCCRR